MHAQIPTAPRSVYPDIVRGGRRLFFSWRLWAVGERCYSMSQDKFYRCISENVRLECDVCPAQGADAGLSPKQLGYTDCDVCESPDWEAC